jgi:mannose-6-phosphate isomerase-like protein (cupin superfamily)
MTISNWTEERPWGRFKNLLESEFTKVKLIQVNPNARLSYQSHLKRRESWTVVQGEALVMLDGREFRLKAGEHIDIPCGSKHRLANPFDKSLSVVEVQTGDYFGEDDISRYDDDFGRK